MTPRIVSTISSMIVGTKINLLSARILRAFDFHESELLFFYPQASINDPKSTFCNQPWDMLFDRTEITRTELWNPDIVSLYYHLV